MIEVRTPDGALIKFPDGTPPETMRAAMERFTAQRSYEAQSKSASPVVNGTVQGVSGMNESLIGALGAPVDAVNWGLNQIGMGSDYPIGGSDFLADAFNTVVQPAQEAMGGTGTGVIAPELPGYETPRAVGRATGAGIAATLAPAAVAPALAGTRAAPFVEMAAQGAPQSLRAAPGFVGGQTAMGAGSVAGSAAGGAVAENTLGPEWRQTGEAIGNLMGGLAPSVAAVGTRNISHALLARPGGSMPEGNTNYSPSSKRIYDAAVAEGVTPSGDLVGRRHAQSYVNAASQMPLAGAGLSSKMDLQNEQWGNALRRTSAKVRGEPYDPQRPIRFEDQIGMDAQDAATAALANLDERIANIQSDLMNRIGPASPVDMTEVKGQLEQMMRSNAGVPEIVTAAKQRLDEIAQMEDLLRPPDVVAPLPSIPNSWEDAMQGFPEPDFYTTVPQPSPGAPYSQVKNFRTNLGFKNQNKQSLPKGENAQVYKRLTEAMETTAFEQGVPPSRFRRVMDETRRANAKTGPLEEGGDKRFLQQLADLKTPREAYNRLFSDPSAWQKLHVMERNAPGSTQGLRADFIERMGTPLPSRAGGAVSWSPDHFLTQWNKLSPNARAFLSDTGDPATSKETLDSLNNLAALASGVRARAGEANQSRSGQAIVNSATIGGGVSLALVNPMILANIAAAMGGAYRVNSPGFAKWLSQSMPTVAEETTKRVPGALGRAFEGYVNSAGGPR